MMRALLAAAVLCACAAPAQAQSLRTRCAAEVAPDYCGRVADAAASVPARTAIIAAGGNPVAGTASTVGMRLPGSPRVSIALRGTAGRVQMPRIDQSDAAGASRSTLIGTSLDGAIGLFGGVNLAPTVGGFGSVDVLASAGLLHATDDELSLRSRFTWGAGARIGVLRESFTAPGLSVSAMYRGLPATEYVLEGEVVDMQLFETTGASAWNVRGTIGKRVLGVGLTGGVAYDRTSNDVRVSYTAPAPGGGALVQLTEDDVTDTRLSYFANLSHTTTILNFVAELGWQQDGERAADAHRSTRRGGLFGSVAIRLAI